MKWKQWKVGAVVSVVLSLFVAMTGVTAGASWHVFIAVLGSALVTHFGAYIKDHPVTEIQFDTQTVEKNKEEEKKP